MFGAMLNVFFVLYYLFLNCDIGRAASMKIILLFECACVRS